MESEKRILVVDSDSAVSRIVEGAAGEEFMISGCASVVSAMALVEEMRPEVVLIGVNLRGALDFAEWLKRKTGSAVILIGTDSFTDGMERCPVDGYAQKPLNIQNLKDVIRKAISSSDEETQPEKDNVYKVVAQEVIAVWGAKGGSGRTVIAANLAHHLKDFKVLLIDLNFCEGPSDLSVYLDLPKTPHIGNFLDDPRNRRESFLNLLVKPKKSHFSVIQPPPTLEQAEKVSCDDVIDLIDQARRLFEISIIDLPTHCSSVTLEAVDMATSAILVTPVHLGSISRLEVLHNIINKNINKGLVVNRHDNSFLNPKEIAHFLDIPLLAVIKEDQELERSVVENCFHTSPNSCFGQGVAEIASRLLGLEQPSSTRKRNLIGMFRATKGGV